VSVKYISVPSGLKAMLFATPAFGSGSGSTRSSAVTR